MSDLHLSPDVYPEPLKWDPGRYLPDRAEDKKRPLGWSGGEQDVILAVGAELLWDTVANPQ
jgi:hypothetical protein